MKNLTKIAALTLGSALALTACGEGGGSSPQAAADSASCEGETIKIAQAAPSFVYLPFYVAQGSGFLDNVGLTPEVIDLSTGANIVSATVTGDVDLGFTTMPEVIKASDEGAPIEAFAAVTGMSTNVAVTKSLMEEKGITEDSSDEEKAQALTGTSFAVTGAGSGSDLVIRYILNKAGVDPDSDLEIIPTGGGSKSVSGFASGRFDGLAVSSPQIDIGMEQGDGAYLFDIANGDYEPLQDTAYIVAVSSSRILDSKAAVMTCFTEAMGLALKQIHEDPDAAAESAQQYMGDIDEDLYNELFPNQVNAYPETPVLNEDSVARSVEFLNVSTGSDVAVDAIDEAINREIAETAVTQLDG